MMTLFLAAMLVSAPPMPSIGIEQRLNEMVPLDLPFRDEYGESVVLQKYFGDKPVVLVFAYTDCPMLCSYVLDGISKTLRIMTMTAGKEFTVLTVSIDPSEQPEKAFKTKETYLRRYTRPEARDGWHFLTGDTASIRSLAQAAGFNYAWDTATSQYAHAAGLMVLTPEGKLAQYFYGIDPSAIALEAAIKNASSSKIGKLAEAILLYCFHYDPETGKYGLAINNILRVAGIATAGGLALFVAVSIVKERRQGRHA